MQPFQITFSIILLGISDSTSKMLDTHFPYCAQGYQQQWYFRKKNGMFREHNVDKTIPLHQNIPTARSNPFLVHYNLVVLWLLKDANQHLTVLLKLHLFSHPLLSCWLIGWNIHIHRSKSSPVKTVIRLIQETDMLLLCKDYEHSSAKSLTMCLNLFENSLKLLSRFDINISEILHSLLDFPDFMKFLSSFFSFSISF